MGVRKPVSGCGAGAARGLRWRNGERMVPPTRLQQQPTEENCGSGPGAQPSKPQSHRTSTDELRQDSFIFDDDDGAEDDPGHNFFGVDSDNDGVPEACDEPLQNAKGKVRPSSAPMVRPREADLAANHCAVDGSWARDTLNGLRSDQAVAADMKQ